MRTYTMIVQEERADGPHCWTTTRMTASYRFTVPDFQAVEAVVRSILERVGFRTTSDRAYRCNEAILGIGRAISPLMLDIVPPAPNYRVCARIRHVDTAERTGVTLTNDDVWWIGTYTDPLTHHDNRHLRFNGFRLQEAMRNADGSMDEPHWDEWFPRSNQNAIPIEELEHLTRNVGCWQEAFTGDADLRDGDGRPGYRRVLTVV